MVVVVVVVGVGGGHVIVGSGYNMSESMPHSSGFKGWDPPPPPPPDLIPRVVPRGTPVISLDYPVMFPDHVHTSHAHGR